MANQNDEAEALKAAATEAQRRLWRVENERAVFLRERREVFLAALEAEAAGLFDARLAEARAELATAQALAEEAVERAALAEQREVPAGTPMEEWKIPRHQYRRGTAVATGRKGLLEIVTRDSPHPGNISEYSRAKVGEVVVRVLKRDGGPSLNYVKGWHVEHEWRVAAPAQEPGP